MQDTSCGGSDFSGRALAGGMVAWVASGISAASNCKVGDMESDSLIFWYFFLKVSVGSSGKFCTFGGDGKGQLKMSTGCVSTLSVHPGPTNEDWLKIF